LDTASEYHELLVQGAMRAVARLKLQFDSNIVGHIISRVLEIQNDGAAFWAAAACPGWNWGDDTIRAFLGNASKRQNGKA
jgi:hypothetical protein